MSEVKQPPRDFFTKEQVNSALRFPGGLTDRCEFKELDDPAERAADKRRVAVEMLNQFNTVRELLAKKPEGFSALFVRLFTYRATEVARKLADRLPDNWVDEVYATDIIMQILADVVIENVPKKA